MQTLLFLASAFSLSSIPKLAFAHGFGSQFTLPLPAFFYISGGVLALVASFLILSLYSTPEGSFSDKARTYRIVLPFWAQKLSIVFSRSGLFFLFLTIITGALGTQFLYENPAPILFWSILLLWFAYTNALFGNLWEIINPFKRIAIWAFQDNPPLFVYPKKIGYLPALLFYYLIIWIELFSGGLGGNALFLSIFLQSYLLVTLLGSFLFGFEKWFTYGDFFSVFFGMIGKFAPILIQKDRLELTVPGERLVMEEEKEPTIILFILFFLSSTIFDGLRETSTWVSVILSLPESINSYFPLLSQATLFLSPILFLAIYFLVIWAMKAVAQESQKVTALALRFVSSLVPIGIAYSLAHYTGPLFIDAQYLIPMVSDPFGLGWNLFGTKDYLVNIAIISPQGVWRIQLFAIILGHIISGYLAHKIARRTFKTKKAVVLGQLPMMALMVLYTAFGLWILSEPYAVGNW